MTKPDQLITIPSSDFSITQTCAELELLLPIFIPDHNSSECQTLQSIGSVCGCPIETNFSTCQLCTETPTSEGSSSSVSATATATVTTSEDSFSSSLINPTNDFPFLEETLGFIPSCEVLEAYLMSSQPQNSSLCFLSQNLFQDYCGCRGREQIADSTQQQGGCILGTDIVADMPLNNIFGNTNEDESFAIAVTFLTCGQLQEAVALVVPAESDTCSFLQRSVAHVCGQPLPENACQMCQIEGPMEFPEKSFPFLGSILDDSALIIPEPTCELVAAYVGSSLVSGTAECRTAELMGGWCGCPPLLVPSCDICDGLTPPDSIMDKIVPYVENEHIAYQPGFVTCGQSLAFQSQLEASSQLCLGIKVRKDVCCGGDYEYFGSDWKHEYVWITRASGFVSLCGTFSIVLYILTDSTRRKNIFNQLMLGMSCLDFIYSIAWIVSTAAVPLDPDAPIYGARGTEATCAIQGVMFQIGLGSIFYNVSFSIYFLLVVVYNWRDDKLKKVRPWLHAGPLVSAFILATASIPFSGPFFIGCFISTPPFAPSHIPIIFLSFIPISIVIILCTALMSILVIKVRQQNNAAKKWRFTPSSAPSHCVSDSALNSATWSSRRDQAKRPRHRDHMNERTRQVTHQAMCYLAAFYVTWPLFMNTIMFEDKLIVLGSKAKAVVFLIVNTLAPLQGFLNTLIFFRLRWLRAWRQWRQKVLRKKQSRETGSVSNNGVGSANSGLFSSTFHVFKSFLRLQSLRDGSHSNQGSSSHVRAEPNDENFESKTNSEKFCVESYDCVIPIEKNDDQAILSMNDNESINSVSTPSKTAPDANPNTMLPET